MQKNEQENKSYLLSRQIFFHRKWANKFKEKYENHLRCISSLRKDLAELQRPDPKRKYAKGWKELQGE